MQSSPSLSRKLKYWMEYGLVRFGFGIFGMMPLKTASNSAGWIARHLGPYFKFTRTATRNLARAFPQWSEEEHEQAMREMWENLGRYAGEFPHIAKLSTDEFFERCELVGREHLDASKKQASLFFSCHMGNWELGAKASAAAGTPMNIVYRPLNNEAVDKLINSYRDQYQRAGISKTTAGGRELINALKNDEGVAILSDQRMSTGIPIPFFGHDAMTATSIADLALKYDAPIYPVQVERLESDAKGPRWRVTIYPPMDYEKTDDAEKDTVTILTAMNRMMEDWIREHPAQWFWLHKRWGKEL